MPNVGKRMRSGLAKLEPEWYESLTPDQALKKYGRSICFRVADTARPNVFEFYCIPFDFGDNQPKNLYDVEEQPPPLPTGIKPFQTRGDIPWMSTFAAAGSSLFCFGGKQRLDIGSSRLSSSAIYRYCYDDTSGESIRGRWYTHGGCQMSRAKYVPEIIDIQGRKLLITGGTGMDKNLEDYDSWAEVFDPYLNYCSPESSMPIELRRSPILVTADLRSRNQILVASFLSNTAFVCDVTTLVWEKFDQSDEFVDGKGNGDSRPFSRVVGKAAVVRDTILCWFGIRGNLLRAYDLNLKMWFEKPIKGFKKVGKLIPDLYGNDFSLLPLDFEHICLLWFDHLPYAPHRVLHCIKVNVSIHQAKEHPIFRASVISYRTHVLKKNSCFIRAVVLGDTWNAGEGSTSRDFGGERSGFQQSSYMASST